MIPVLVLSEPAPSPPAASLLDACTSVVAPERCVEADTGSVPVAVVTFRSQNRVEIRVERAGFPAARELTFLPEDLAEARYEAVGLMLGALWVELGDGIPDDGAAAERASADELNRSANTAAAPALPVWLAPSPPADSELPAPPASLGAGAPSGYVTKLMGAVAALAERTEIALGGPGAAVSEERLGLTSGTVSLAVPPLAAGHTLVVATPIATVSVVGTRFSVTVQPTTETSQLRSCVSVAAGKVRVASAGDQRLLAAGEGWSSDGLPCEVAPATLPLLPSPPAAVASLPTARDRSITCLGGTMIRLLASIPLALFTLTACDLDGSDVELRTGGGGGTGGAPATGGAAGATAKGGAGGVGSACPDGMKTIASEEQCYADGTCYELDDGTWCTGGAQVDCRETTTPVWFSESQIECLPSDVCAVGFGVAPDETGCPRAGACYGLDDGTWCAQWRTEQRCPQGFSVVAVAADCASDVSCYELPDGAWCSGQDSSVDVAVFEAIIGYGFEVDGEPEVSEVALPADPLATAQWGVVEYECQESGSTLLPYAGQTVSLTNYAINRSCMGYPIRLSVLTQGDALVCTYFTIAPGDYSLAPGVFSVTSAECR